MVALPLVLSSHPLPSLAVTGFATACALVLGGSPGQAAGVAVATLAGQLCVGWTNDAWDAGRDRAAGRLDKPLARPDGPAVRTVWIAAVLAGALCVPLSLRLGWWPGGLHLVAVAAAVGYDLRLKSTVLSPVPYLIAFGLLPVVVTAVVTDRSWPPAGQVLAAALLGVAAHFGNTVDDTAADALTGVRGLPQRLGPQPSTALMAGLVALAAVVLLLAGGPAPTPAGASVLLAGTALAGAVAAGVGGRSSSAGRWVWRLTLAAVGLVVTGFLITLASA